MGTAGITVYVCKRKTSKNWYARYQDPQTGRDIWKTTKTDVKEEAERIASELEEKINRGKIIGSSLPIDLATNEEKIREFIRIEAVEAVEARKRRIENLKGQAAQRAGKSGSAAGIAAKAVGMSKGSARKGKAVIEYIDSIDDEDEKKELIDTLNKAVNSAYALLPDNKPDLKKTVDSSVNRAIYGLARKFDDCASLFGGESYRNDCIALLKHLSAKYEEWKRER